MLPNVPFLACLSRWAGDELIGYNSAAAGRRTTATKRTRFGTFPPYLFIALQRLVLAGIPVPMAPSTRICTVPLPSVQAGTIWSQVAAAVCPCL